VKKMPAWHLHVPVRRHWGTSTPSSRSICSAH